MANPGLMRSGLYLVAAGLTSAKVAQRPAANNQFTNTQKLKFSKTRKTKKKIGKH